MSNGQFIKPEDLDWKRAYRRVLQNSYSDFVPLRTEYWLLSKNCLEYINRAKELLQQDHYNPAPLSVIEVPKSDMTTRPAAIAELPDRLIYQALVDKVADIVEPQLQAVVFSHRLVSDRSAATMFRDYDASYGAFIQKQKSICETNHFNYVVVADVASYYERIYHHKLVDLLIGLGSPEELVRTLGHLLREWNNGDSHGIPQGFWSSDYLGNVYLHQVDVAMVMKKHTYLRYVDDMVLFCNSISEARKLLLEISKEIRNLGLGLQAAKTDIIPVQRYQQHITPACDRIKQAAEKISSSVKLKLNAYFDEFTEDDISEFKHYIDSQALRKVFDEIIIAHKINEPLLKYCLKTLTATEDPYAQDFVLQNLDVLPHLSSYFGNYLCKCPFDERTLKRIRHFLESEKNIYDWQAMWLLRYVGRTSLSRETRRLVRDIFVNRNNHNSLRSLAGFMLGFRGDIADQRLVMDSYESEPSELFRRCVICGLVTMPKAERNHFMKYHKHDSWSLRIACSTILGTSFS